MKNKKLDTNKIVHLSFTQEDHEKLKEKAKSYDMPMATYSKMVVLENINQEPVIQEVEEDVYFRKPRTVKRQR